MKDMKLLRRFLCVLLVVSGLSACGGIHGTEFLGTVTPVMSPGSTASPITPTPGSGPQMTLTKELEPYPGVIFLGTSSDTDPAEIFKINSDGSNIEHVLTLARGLSSPALSPDRQRVVAQDIRDYLDVPAGQYCCYTTLSLMDITGNNVVRLTTGSNFDINPAWSPDGKKIAFISTRDIGLDIYVIDVSSSEVTRMTVDNEMSEGCLSWSPDGRSIVFGALDTSAGQLNHQAHLAVVNLISKSVTNLIPDLASEYICPSWSPDGSRIAFASVHGNTSNIFVINPDGTNLKHLTSDQTEDSKPVWSPDGSQLAYSSSINGPSRTYLINAEDGTGLMMIGDIEVGLAPLLWMPY